MGIISILYNLCSFFSQKCPFHGNFGNFFHWYLCRNRYTVCVEFENVMKSTQKKIVYYITLCPGWEYFISGNLQNDKIPSAGLLSFNFDSKPPNSWAYHCYQFIMYIFHKCFQENWPFFISP